LSHPPPVILTIAGHDPSAGAGILADIKTISAFGCYGVAAVTSVTFQNTQGVYGARHLSREEVRRQIEPLFDDFEIAAVKTGMLPTTEIIEEVAAILASARVPHVVVDPVVRSTSGYDLIDDSALRTLIRSLFPLASVVTPNAAETERITGIKAMELSDMKRGGEALFKLGARAALVKGGDTKSETATDLLVDKLGATPYTSERIKSKSTHGTGCTLSSALASLLARGNSLRDSIPIAKQYITLGIRTAPALGAGHGPLSHFPRFPLEGVDLGDYK
jgi:hydroxymethylpyrimidine kinase/phosphomethylpyrimidine kinase